MQEYVYIDGKKYRRGYTTGSCASAASKASVHMLLTKEKIENINIDTPKGIPLTLKVKNKAYHWFIQCKREGSCENDGRHR